MPRATKKSLVLGAMQIIRNIFLHIFDPPNASISSAFNACFFVPMSFWQLFSSYMYVEKADKMMFVHKIRTFKVDEIDYMTTCVIW